MATDYTPEQVQMVNRIKAKSNLYDIMGVSTTCTESELKKSYRKLAIKLHPDKNKAPGASDAFKKISAAYSILSDPKKKRQYDLSGDDTNLYGASAQQPGFRGQGGNYTYHFQGGIDPDEIFRAFFGGSPFGDIFAQQNRQRRTYRRRRQQQNENGNNQPQQGNKAFVMLFQFLPILILILSSFGSFFQSTPDYSFRRSSEHVIYRKTSNLNVEYFAKRKFATKYRYNMRKIETQIENDYLTILRQNCKEERYHMRELKYYATNAYSSQMRKAYKNQLSQYTAVNCNKLKEVYARS